MILFVYKLIKVYKDSDDVLTVVITKTTLLVTISVAATFIHLTSTVFRLIGRDLFGFEYFDWIDNFIVLADIFTNYLCIILSYKTFRNYYSRYCTWFDSKCRICCAKVVDQQKSQSKLPA